MWNGKCQHGVTGDDAGFGTRRLRGEGQHKD